MKFHLLLYCTTYVRTNENFVKKIFCLRSTFHVIVRMCIVTLFVQTLYYSRYIFVPKFLCLSHVSDGCVP